MTSISHTAAQWLLVLSTLQVELFIMSDSEDEGQYEDDDAKFEEILAGAGVGEEENQQEDSSDGEQDVCLCDI